MADNGTPGQPRLFEDMAADMRAEARFPPTFSPRNGIEVYLDTPPKFRRVNGRTLVAGSKPPRHRCSEPLCGDTATRWVGMVGEAELTPYCGTHGPENPW